MNNTEVQIMAMRLERERQVRQHIEEGRILRALAEQPSRAERSDRGSVPQRAWHVANGALQSRWTVFGPCRGERGPRVTTADELVMEVSGGR
jgi:hypothetical protein